MPIFLFWLILIGMGVVPVRAAEPVNLALGRRVEFLPAPNYATTMAGGTDATDLTDGKLSTRTDQKIWGDAKSVGYSYPGLVQMAVDLGALSEVGEVAIRFSGGSESAGTSFPTSVDLVVSNDGVNYHRAAGYSRFTPGDQAKYGIPNEAGVSWVHKLRFQNVNVRARYVGIAFYGTAYCASDELYVLSGDPAASYVGVTWFPADDFRINGPRLYFHKPVVMLPTNMNAPTPIGLIAPTTFTKTLTARIDLPAGVRIAGGRVGGKLATSVTGTAVDGGYTRYTYTGIYRTTAKEWARLYLRDDAPDGQAGKIRYQLSWTGSSTPLIEQPIRALAIGSAPQPRRIMAGLGWWGLNLTQDWPNAVADFTRIGFNTLPLFSQTNLGSTTNTTTIAQFRAAGFKVLNIDSTLHVMISSAGSRANELYCQYSDGTVGTYLCLSYRGDLYTAELARLANECAAMRADYLSSDIELWDYKFDPSKCTRCQADYAASGAASWTAWKLMKGEQMWRDIAGAIRARAGELGIQPPELGCYDFRPGMNYQSIWPYDRLYPDWLANSQVSTYSPLYPYNITFVGNEARQDRQRLPKSDVMPYICPGDAGTFPGEMLTWALLECYANGSRGVHFWSPRVWDAESIDAHARALRMIAPVEDVIVDGDLATSVTCQPAMRVSGMKRGGEMFLLIAKDYEPYSGSVRVTMPAAIRGEVVDLDTGAVAATLAGQREFTISFNNQRARALWVKPARNSVKRPALLY